MRSAIVLLASAALASAQASTDAPVVTSNPAGASYFATLPNRAGTDLRGTVSATSGADGKGVNFAVSLSGLPTAGGPFLYHIHEKPVPTDGNCTGTGAHLDPYKRGEDPPCDSTKKESCQVGDLSGKYGKINGTSFTVSYNDLYTSTNPTINSYFGNLSIVVHFANKTRISCANFTTIATGYESKLPPAGTPSSAPSGASVTVSSVATGTGGANSGANVPTGTNSTVSTPAPTLPQATGGASVMGMSVGAVLFAGIVALGL